MTPTMTTLLETDLPAPSTSFTQSNALAQYMATIRGHPLLTREEEHDLAVEYATTRDPALATRLVTANLRLVVKIARTYCRDGRDFLDYVQEGNMGLLRAVEKFDPARSVKLSS